MEEKKELATEEQLTYQTVKDLIAPNAEDREIRVFLKICQATGLNPFKREIHLVKYRGRPAFIHTGYETYLKRASRHKKYAGFKCWTEHTDRGELVKACVEIRRKDWELPLYWEVLASEYIKMITDKETGEVRPMSTWKEKPETMLKKVAISQAFKLAFPDEMAGLPSIRQEIRNFEKEPDRELPTKPKKKLTSASHITQDQLQQLIIHQKQANVTDDEFKEWLLAKYGDEVCSIPNKPSRRLIKQKWLGEVTQWLHSKKQESEKTEEPEIPAEPETPAEPEESEKDDFFGTF